MTDERALLLERIYRQADEATCDNAGYVWMIGLKQRVDELREYDNRHLIEPMIGSEASE